MIVHNCASGFHCIQNQSFQDRGLLVQGVYNCYRNNMNDQNNQAVKKSAVFKSLGENFVKCCFPLLTVTSNDIMHNLYTLVHYT